MSKPDYHVVSFSGGKDSTAMLLRMIELNMPIDCILFCDTGLEFPAMYKHVEKVERDIGRPITRVKATEEFEYLLLDKIITRKKNTALYGTSVTGYGWAGPKMRWCTEKLKTQPRDAFLRELREKYNVLEYVGLAADEGYRMSRKINQQANHRHPLMEWGWTEEDCLKYCYDHGYDWDGLYNHFKRASCWCCPLQSLSELRQLYRYYPDLWAKLKEWDKRTWRQFRADFSVEQLEVRFQLEEEFISAGKSVHTKPFFTELYRRIGRENKL